MVPDDKYGLGRVCAAVEEVGLHGFKECVVSLHLSRLQCPRSLSATCSGKSVDLELSNTTLGRLIQ